MISRQRGQLPRRVIGRPVPTLLLLFAACGSLPAAGEPGAAPAPAELPPAGFGTLRQEQFTLELRDGAVQLRVTPLEEEVIRLAAPDSYRRLSGLAEQQRAALRERPLAGAGGGAPLLFLVSFFSREGGTGFEPTEVMIESGGQLFRPLRVVGLTPAWGEQRLSAQQPETAVYLFAAGIDLGQPLVLRYGTRSTDAWREIMPLLQEERSRAFARAAGK